MQSFFTLSATVGAAIITTPPTSTPTPSSSTNGNTPYQITDGPPCIDAGTLANLPDFIESSEYDLAGNPRIVGDSIDMGAYEWNPTVGIDKQ